MAKNINQGVTDSYKCLASMDLKLLIWKLCKYCVDIDWLSESFHWSCKCSHQSKNVVHCKHTVLEPNWLLLRHENIIQKISTLFCMENICNDKRLSVSGLLWKTKTLVCLSSLLVEKQQQHQALESLRSK